MSAVEHCRSAALGGHALRCSSCAQPQIAYNSCRNRHCPKCQSSAAQRWLEARSADLLPVEYYHVVFTLPAPISALAYTNKELMYGLLFDLAAETLRAIAADPKHLGACIGTTLVLHTWGSALTHHPHVHGIVPGGGLAPDADRWVPCKPGFFLSVRVLSRLFRRRFLEEIQNAHRDGQLKFFGEHIDLADAEAFADWLMPLRQCEWVVYAKRPFAGPAEVLAYLSRYTHRVAISNSRLVALDDRGVTFRWKDYRDHGSTRYKTMTLKTEEFMRRFLLHVLPVRLSPHPPLWLTRQRQSQNQNRHCSPASASASAATCRRAQRWPRRPVPSGPPSCAGTVARPCSSSTPSLAHRTSADRQSRSRHDQQRFNRRDFPGDIYSSHAVANFRRLVLQNPLWATPQRPLHARHCRTLATPSMPAAQAPATILAAPPLADPQIPIAPRTS